MENSATFLSYWDKSMRLGSYASFAVAILIFLLYEYKVSRIKDLKSKYDFVNLNEIKYFWYSLIVVIVAIAFFINSMGTSTLAVKTMLWFYVRLFITASFVIISYFIFFGVVKVYYPKSVEKRLKRLRDRPRVSPNGNIMRRLSEEEEDVHLEPSQIAEEAIHSIDYDVWIDEKTGYKKIEKYFSYQHAEECPQCGYYTFKIDTEEIEKQPTQTDPGIIIKHFECYYCRHREARRSSLAKLSENA